jgi:Trypsin-like peptidase domain
MPDYSALGERVKAATVEFDRHRAADACSALIDSILEDSMTPPAGVIRGVLSALRNKRYFDLMARVGDAAIQAGQNDPQVRRQYAQCLIELGHITAALSVLALLVAETGETGALKNPSEHAEARGLIGRAHKQAYVNAAGGADPSLRTIAGRGHLERAIEAYSTVYRSDPDRWLWHGINTVACAHRARRDGITHPAFPDPRDIAAAILEKLDAVIPRQKVEIWDRATAVEACVALDRLPDALEWLAVYARDPGADAFELGSTLRQLTEVWQLVHSSEPGSSLLPVLESALLQREGGRVDLDAASLQSGAMQIDKVLPSLEAVLGDTRFVPLTWYRTGLQRCASVARIENAWGQGFGTGFLVRGDDLHPSLAGEIVLVTNAHVISNDPAVQKGRPPATPPERARVRFQGREDTERTYAIKDLIFTSPPHALDATVLRLETALTCDPPYPLAIAPPVASRDRVYVIGHPQGGPLSISIQDNRVVDVKEPMLRYRAPTEPGSSGSPVFNQDWELVALHHAGSKQLPSLSGEGVQEANEGIWMSSIISALKVALPGATS